MRRLPPWWPVALLIVVVTAVQADILVGRNALFAKDLTTYHYPMKKALHDIVERGEFPWWNPLHGGGEPIAANPAYELFYPPQWLIFLPDFDLGYRLHIALHLYLAALGMYFLLRDLRAGAIASLIGAMAFALGGPYFSLVRTLPFFFSMAWVPLICLFARRTMRERRAGDAALAALTIALQALVGEPTVALQTWALIGAYAIFRGFVEVTASKRRSSRMTIDRGELIRSLGLAIGMVLIGLLIASVQLIPGFDHASDSVRAEGFSLGRSLDWSFPAKRTFELLVPAIFQNASRNGQPLMKTLYPNGESFVGSVYLGLPIALAAIAGFFSRERGRWLVLIITIFGFITATGALIFPLLHAAGVFRSIRYPEKFVLIPCLVLIVWGALAIGRMLEGDDALARRMRLLAIVWLVIASMVALSSATGTYAWLILLRGAVLVAVLTMLGRPKWRSLAVATLVLFVVLDLRFLDREHWQRMPAGYFDPPEIDREIPKSGHFRIFHSADWAWAFEDARVVPYFVVDPKSFWWNFRNGEFPRIPWNYGHAMALIEDIDSTSLQPSADLLQAMLDVRRSGRQDWQEIFFAMSNVHYKFEPQPFEIESKRVAGDFTKSMPVRLVETEKNPRYYFADALVRANDRTEFTYKLTTQSWSRRVAFVTLEPFEPAAGSVDSVAETSSSATVRVTATGRSFLVLSVTPHKFWRATLDGRPVDLQVTNVGYQGVVVPAGRHELKMTYRNPRVVAGGVVSAVTLLGLAVFVITTGRR